MIAETIKIADVSVHYGSVKFFYSIDLSSYLKSAENDGANQSTEATPSAARPLLTHRSRQPSVVPRRERWHI